MNALARTKPARHRECGGTLSFVLDRPVRDRYRRVGQVETMLVRCSTCRREMFASAMVTTCPMPPRN